MGICFLGNVYSICRVKWTDGDGATEGIFHIQELGKMVWAEQGGKKNLCNFLFTPPFAWEF